MSCPPELTYAVYVDGELPPEELRPVEAHLVSCLECRALVLSLREEAQTLGDVLLDRARSTPETAEAPARGLAIGLGPALVATALGSVAIGWIADEAWPAALPFVSPLALGGIYDMAFDLFYLLRDEAPAALEVGLAVAAMATVSAVLSLGLTGALRRWSGPTLLALTLLLTLLAAPREGHAHFGIHEHRDYTLAAGEVHDGTLLAHGDAVTIEGIVEGDLLAFTRRLVLRGEVRGSLITIARDAEITGVVTGTAVVAGRSGRISGRIGGNLYGYGGEHLDVEPSARLERDVAAGGEAVRIEGAVGRDLFAAGDEVEIRGPVGRNVHAWAESLRLLDGARVGGDVDAILPRGEQVEVAAGASVAGEVGSRTQMGHRGRGFAALADPRTYAWMALHVGAGLVVGLALCALLPGLFAGRLQTGGAFFRSLAIGLAGLVLPPIAACLLALTLVGIPLALMGLLLWLMMLYCALIVVSFLVGRSVVTPRADGWAGFSLPLAVGLVIVVALTHAPYVGGILWAISLLCGVGLIADRLRAGLPALGARLG